MRIISLTLNPAFDMHCSCPGFQAYRENVAHITDYNAGGKGVNISRALMAGGIANEAIVILGQENAVEFVRKLKEDGLSFETISVPGRIRENITLHTEGAPETRISFPGFTVESEVLAPVEEKLSDVGSDTVVILAGSLPKGISLEQVKAFLARLAQRGAKVVIDSNAFSVEDLIEVRPWLIKPNGEEIERYAGKAIESFAQAAEWARKLHQAGIANVMVSMGGHGAILVCEEGSFAAEPPCIQPVSTIGAGDSSIAGFLEAAFIGASPVEHLRHAVSYGTAACLTPGTCPPVAEEIQKVYQQIIVKKI